MATSNKTEWKNWRTDSKISVSRMCFSVLYRKKLTANGLSKPKQKVWDVRQTILETAIEKDCGKRCS